MSERPSLLRARLAFREVYDDIGKTVSAVGSKIGGRVNHNINVLTPEQGQFRNACAIRMSYVLNRVGPKVPFINGKTVSGGQGNWYLFRVRDLINFLHNQLGEPDVMIEDPSASKFANHKGILVMEVRGWSDASGHATIWTGLECAGQCYFPQSHKAYLWTLKD